MSELSIPYGKEKIEITLAKENIFNIIQPRKTGMQNSMVVLARAIENPVDSQSLRDFIGTKDPVLCIINDATRPTKTSEFLAAMEEDIQTELIQFLVATGAHRAPTERELQMILGRFYEKFRKKIMVHDARDDRLMRCFGKTRHGNEIWLNKAFNEFSKILVIGSVEPHYFAGFTGGRKSILPGVAAYRTIEGNHKFAVHAKAQPLNLKGNPVHEEMIDCITALNDHQLFSVQMVLDRNHNIYEAFTGSLGGTFEMAARTGAKLYRSKITTRAEVVVTVAQWPFDINLYQTLKAIEHGRMAVEEGGILIVVSPCHEGLGPRNFARLFDSAKSIEHAIQSALIRYRLGDHNAINLASLRRFCEIWSITRIPASILERVGIKGFDSLQHAIEKAIEKRGKNTKILFMMDGSLTVPEIS
jgi:nickel-dependent lactate racemase